jgi:hypothetical protein
MPLGPSRAAKPFVTSRTVHPSIVVGLVSGTGVSCVSLFASFPLTRIDLGCCREPVECPIIDEPSGPVLSEGLAGLLVEDEKSFALSSALGSPMLS